MITKKHTAIVTLAVCAVALAALGSALQPVERPHQVRGHITVVVNLLNGEAVLLDWGESSQFGRYSALGSGKFARAAYLLHSANDPCAEQPEIGVR